MGALLPLDLELNRTSESKYEFHAELPEMEDETACD
jgi:hypothetical protein